MYAYNQRAVCVLSYVAQFAVPPDSYKFSPLLIGLCILFYVFLLIVFLGILPILLVFVLVLALTLLTAIVPRLGIDLLSARLLM